MCDTEQITSLLLVTDFSSTTWGTCSTWDSGYRDDFPQPSEAPSKLAVQSTSLSATTCPSSSSLAGADQWGGQVCKEGVGGQIPFHLFPAPADKNRGHYLDDLLFQAFVLFCFIFFNFTKSNMHIFQTSIVPCYWPTQLTTLQLANRWIRLCE